MFVKHQAHAPEVLPPLSLGITRLRLFYRAAQPVTYPGFLGSTWRGALGHALKKLVCVTRLPECPQCLLYRSCAYPYVFETPAPENRPALHNLREVPHPFVLSLPFRTPPAAESLTLGLTLFGRASAYTPYLIHALQSCAANLRALPELSLQSVEQQPDLSSPTWRQVYPCHGALPLAPPAIPAIPAPPGPVWIRLHTPLRLRHIQNYVNPSTFSFTALFRNLLRRIALLSEFHEINPLQLPFKDLAALSSSVPVSNPQLAWVDWTRFSSRQQARMQMGGLIGSFSVDLSPFPTLWPFLYLGQFTHAGKATSMGLGRYSLHTNPAEARDAC